MGKKRKKKGAPAQSESKTDGWRPHNWMMVGAIFFFFGGAGN
jgi:hypothetical protein